MKPVLVELHTFFKEKGFEVVKINIKLTSKGQVETSFGELEKQPKYSLKQIIKQFRKKYQSIDWRFHNTELDLEVYDNYTSFTIRRL